MHNSTSQAERGAAQRRPGRRRRAAAAVTSVAAVGLLAACTTASDGPANSAGASTSGSTRGGGTTGSASAGKPTSGEAALTKAKATLLKSRAVRISLVGTDDGQPIRLDLSYAPHGTFGSVTNEGFQFMLVVIGTTVYFKAPDAFLRQQAGSDPATNARVLARLSGKWIKTTTSNTDFTQFSEVANRIHFINQLFADTDAGSYKVGDVRSVDGVACYPVSGSDGTIYVAQNDGRPIQIDSTDDKDKGTIKMSRYGQVADPVAPPQSQVVDLAALTGG